MAKAEVLRVCAENDYYKILQLPRSCSLKDVKTAYRKLALLLHPDKCKVAGAEDAFKKVSTAYKCLSDSSARQNYDISGTDPDNSRGGGGTPVDLDEIFRQFMQENNAGGLPRPFVFHTFNFGGSRQPSTTTEGGNSMNWILVLLVAFLLYLIYAFFSFLVYNIRRVILLVLCFFIARLSPVEYRNQIRMVLLLIAILTPLEYITINLVI